MRRALLWLLLVCACGAETPVAQPRAVIVANDAGVWTVHAHPASQIARSLAYDPRDTEHWYLDRARCEQDAAARRQLAAVALAFETHHGCG